MNIYHNSGGNVITESPHTSTTEATMDARYDDEEGIQSLEFSTSFNNHEIENEDYLRNTYKDIWKRNQSSTGGFQVKLYQINCPSYAHYYPVIFDIMNQSGQLQIYLKARTIVEVLKMFVQQVQINHRQFGTQLHLSTFTDIIYNSRYLSLIHI